LMATLVFAAQPVRPVEQVADLGADADHLVPFDRLALAVIPFLHRVGDGKGVSEGNLVVVGLFHVDELGLRALAFVERVFDPLLVVGIKHPLHRQVADGVGPEQDRALFGLQYRGAFSRQPERQVRARGKRTSDEDGGGDRFGDSGHGGHRGCD
jgi:hypothetical protein